MKSLDKPNSKNSGLINNQPTNTGLVDKKKTKELTCNKHVTQVSNSYMSEPKELDYIVVKTNE